MNADSQNYLFIANDGRSVLVCEAANRVICLEYFNASNRQIMDILERDTVLVGHRQAIDLYRVFVRDVYLENVSYTRTSIAVLTEWKIEESDFDDGTTMVAFGYSQQDAARPDFPLQPDPQDLLGLELVQPYEPPSYADFEMDVAKL